jgi:hypothetical protein
MNFSSLGRKFKLELSRNFEKSFKLIRFSCVNNLVAVYNSVWQYIIPMLCLQACNDSSCSV